MFLQPFFFIVGDRQRKRGSPRGREEEVPSVHEQKRRLQQTTRLCPLDSCFVNFFLKFLIYLENHLNVENYTKCCIRLIFGKQFWVELNFYWNVRKTFVLIEWNCSWINILFYKQTVKPFCCFYFHAVHATFKYFFVTSQATSFFCPN